MKWTPERRRGRGGQRAEMARQTKQTAVPAADLSGENDVNEGENPSAVGPDGWPGGEIECDQCTVKGAAVRRLPEVWRTRLLVGKHSAG